MKLFVFFIIGVACAAAQTDCVPQTQEEKAYYQVVSGLEAFAINLYQEVASSLTGNVVVSPFSVAVVLLLTLIGARGRTSQEMGDVLHMPLSRKVVAQGFRVLMDSLPTATNQSDEEALLQLANRLYVQSGLHIENSYLNTAVQDFRSGVEELNFADSENARNSINQWIANNTNDRILEAVPPGVITADTKLILVNAILFRAMWLHQFSESATTNQTFYLSDSNQVNVSMMHGSFLLGYCELPNFNATALLLPYKSGALQSHMLIVLPNNVDGLQPLEENLGQLPVSSLEFEYRKVNAHIPSFKMEMSIPLTQLLQQLGINVLFGPQANLSGISNEPLFVSDVIQKAYIRVDENGTEAAAATVLVVGITSEVSPNEPIEFIADRPFLYFLMADKNILFMGRVVNPNE